MSSQNQSPLTFHANNDGQETASDLVNCKNPVWIRLLVSGSLFALVALIAVTCLVLSRVDSTVIPFGSALVAIVSFGAVLFGIFDSKTEEKVGWTKVAFRWVDRCSRSVTLTILHTLLMASLCVCVAWGGLASLYRDVKLDPSTLSQPGRYRIKTRDYLGNIQEVKFDAGYLDPAWLPFAMFRGRLLKVVDDKEQITECLIRSQMTVCNPFQDTKLADYSISHLKDGVDFRAWRPFELNSHVATSIVNRQLSLGLTRLTGRDFDRWTASSSPFSEDCVVLSANAFCEEKLPGTFETNRRNSLIVLDKEAFPIGTEKELVYVVNYKNTFTFTPTEQQNACLGCDVTFTSVYPVDNYQMAMSFPTAWTWDRVVVTVTAVDGSSYSLPIVNTAREPMFKYSAAHLPAGVHITYSVFPDRHIPRI